MIDDGDTEGEEAPQEGENVEVSPVKPMSSYPSPPPANHEEQDSEEAEDEVRSFKSITIRFILELAVFNSISTEL